LSNDLLFVPLLTIFRAIGVTTEVSATDIIFYASDPYVRGLRDAKRYSSHNIGSAYCLNEADVHLTLCVSIGYFALFSFDDFEGRLITPGEMRFLIGEHVQLGLFGIGSFLLTFIAK